MTAPIDSPQRPSPPGRNVASVPADQAGGPDPARPGMRTAAWAGWRHWRSSRPFWGALLMIAGGAELLVTLQAGRPATSAGWVGLAGPVQATLGVCLIVSGLLTWFHPVQRSLYSTAAILLATAALMTADVGGFVAGTVLGAAGGALGFAWVPAGKSGGRAGGAADTHARGLTLIVTERERRS